jgi:hypothetical protein
MSLEAEVNVFSDSAGEAWADLLALGSITLISDTSGAMYITSTAGTTIKVYDPNTQSWINGELMHYADGDWQGLVLQRWVNGEWVPEPGLAD